MISCSGLLVRPLPRFTPSSPSLTFTLLSPPLPPSPMTMSPFCVSATHQRRIGKRVRNVPEFKRKAMEKGPWWKQPAVVMTSPLARTIHPEDKWGEVESELELAVKAASEPDMPVSMEDPYCPEPSTCILCPRRFAPGCAPQPDYKNPKLLSQFVSPHTGLVYEHHVTGLCRSMQESVEKAVRRSQDAGFMSTRVKPRHYLQDPQLFNSSRPVKSNPY